jgi:hypothetical protein
MSWASDLALGEELRGVEEQLGALRRRHEAPALVGGPRGVDGPRDVTGG